MRSIDLSLIREWSWMLWPCSMLVWAWWLFMVVPVATTTISDTDSLPMKTSSYASLTPSQDFNLSLPSVSEPVALSGAQVAQDDWKHRRTYSAGRLAPYPLIWLADHQVAMYALSVIL